MEKTLQQLDRVISFHHVADEVEAKVREGPVASIEAYLKLLEKLHVAVEFFTQNNPGSVELSHVNELFETGLEMLQKEFLQLLKRHSKPVPVPILHDIAVCEDMEGMCVHVYICVSVCGSYDGLLEPLRVMYSCWVH